MPLLCAQQTAEQTDQTRSCAPSPPGPPAVLGEETAVCSVLGSFPGSRERDTTGGGGIIHVNPICLIKVLAQESRLPSQLLGSGRRTLPLPPSLRLASTQSALGLPQGPGGREWEPLPTGQQQVPSGRQQPLVGGRHLRGEASGTAALTDGLAALVSINEGHDGAQGHVRVVPDLLQVADGVLDALCKEGPRCL